MTRFLLYSHDVVRLGIFIWPILSEEGSFLAVYFPIPISLLAFLLWQHGSSSQQPCNCVCPYFSLPLLVCNVCAWLDGGLVVGWWNSGGLLSLSLSVSTPTSYGTPFALLWAPSYHSGILVAWHGMLLAPSSMLCACAFSGHPF